MTSHAKNIPRQACSIVYPHAFGSKSFVDRRQQLSQMLPDLEVSSHTVSHRWPFAYRSQFQPAPLNAMKPCYSEAMGPTPVEGQDDHISIGKQHAYAAVRFTEPNLNPKFIPTTTGELSPPSSCENILDAIFDERKVEEVLSQTALPSPQNSTHSSHDTHDPDIQAQARDDIEWLNQAAEEYTSIRCLIESKLRTLSSNASVGPTLTQKIDFMSIVDLIASQRSTEQVDGMLMLQDFLNEHESSLNWDGLTMLFLQVMRFIPTQKQLKEPPEFTLTIKILIWDAACICIWKMCTLSQSILEHARLLDAVPRILSLIKYVATSNTTMAKP